MADGRARLVTPAPTTGCAPRERVLSAIELGVLIAGSLAALWLGPWLVAGPGFVPAARILFCLVFAYVTYLSPVWLHRDSLAERGVGSWRSGFVRTDNLRPAAARFAWLAAAGSLVILLAAAVWNPGWVERASWKAWAVRLFFYALSSSAQVAVFLGFGLVRLRKLLAASPSTAAAPTGPSRQQVLLVAAVAALVFSGLHAPDPAAVALTAVFGFFGAWISVRTPNLFAAAACQTLLGLLVHRVLELHLQIGGFYYHPDIHPVRMVVPFAERLIGNLY
jgi:hypothetical protein